MKGKIKPSKNRIDADFGEDGVHRALTDLNGCSQLNDAGLKEIGKFRNLVVLDLSNTGVTDAGLKELRDLKDLKYLNLTGSAITDAGLEHLKELNSLETIHISRTDTSQEGEDELRKTFPNAEIKRTWP